MVDGGRIPDNRGLEMWERGNPIKTVTAYL